MDDTRAVYVSALDASGAPVKDLTAAEVSIKENGRPQPVVSLGPAMAKMSIAVLVDDGGFGIEPFRLGIARLINRLILDAEFSLAGLAGQNKPMVEFTQRSDVLVPAVLRLRATTGPAGQHVIEAVGAALGDEERHEAARPVVIVAAKQSREAGSGLVGPVMERLGRTRAILEVIEVAQRLPGGNGNAGTNGDIHAFSRDNDAAEADRARSQLLNDGSAASGGRRQQLLDVAGVPSAMSAIAEELAAQYVLVFHSGADAADASHIAITTTRAGVKIHAPAQATARPIR